MALLVSILAMAVVKTPIDNVTSQLATYSVVIFLLLIASVKTSQEDYTQVKNYL